MTTIGMPIAIQCTNGTRTPPNFSMKPEPEDVDRAAGRRADAADQRGDRDADHHRLGERDCPATSPILSNRPSATAMKTAAHGTSDTIVESAAGADHEQQQRPSGRAVGLGQQPAGEAAIEPGVGERLRDDEHHQHEEEHRAHEAGEGGAERRHAEHRLHHERQHRGDGDRQRLGHPQDERRRRRARRRDDRPATGRRAWAARAAAPPTATAASSQIAGPGDRRGASTGAIVGAGDGGGAMKFAYTSVPSRVCQCERGEPQRASARRIPRPTAPRRCAIRSSRSSCIPQTLTELTGPVFGHEAIGPLDHDLTRQHAGEPLGQRIVVEGRVLDEDGRPVPHTLIEVWQANAAGRYAHKVDQWHAPARRQLQRRRPHAHRRRGPLSLRDDPARRLPVAQPPQRLAAGAHPLLAVRPGVPHPPGHADVLPRRSAAARSIRSSTPCRTRRRASA